MKITVVCAVYNAEKTLRASLDSFFSQIGVITEVIVIDGGSSDATASIVRSYGPRIDVFVSEPDQGIYDALNKGIRLASGEILGFLHSDDVLADEHALWRVLERFQADPGLAAVYGDLSYVSREDSGRLIRHWRAGAERSWHLGWMPPHPTLYCRRELYTRLGAFDTGLRIAADYEWMLRLYRAAVRWDYIPEEQVRMRVGGASNRSLGNLVRKSSEDWIALRRHGWSRTGAACTLLAKNLRKLPQFMPRAKADRRDRV